MSEKIKINYKTKENYKGCIKYIRNFINENEEVIIVNIGTDRCIGDVIAPLVGTMLIENNCPIKTYGTIEDPIHALNINRKLKEIKENHPNAKIIGIDACLGEDVGEIQIRDYPIHPGKGVGKNLPAVGDVSIIGIVDSNSDNLFDSKNIRFDLVYKISSLIVNIILKAANPKRKKTKLYNNKIHKNVTNKNMKAEIATN